MPDLDELLARAARHADDHPGPLPPQPRIRASIVTCMDARVDPWRLFDLQPGDAHVMRNAGAVVSDDVLRSLAISQHLLDTEFILLIAHTNCGLRGLEDDEFARRLGHEPPWPLGAFADVEEHVREGVRRICACRDIPRRDAVRGFVYDVDTGRLNAVALD